MPYRAAVPSVIADARRTEPVAGNARIGQRVFALAEVGVRAPTPAGMPPTAQPPLRPGSGRYGESPAGNAADRDDPAGETAP